MDSDDDILDSAYKSCIQDLRKAENLCTKQDGTLSLFHIRNVEIRRRAARPQDYDRQGSFVHRTPTKEKILELSIPRPRKQSSDTQQKPI